MLCTLKNPKYLQHSGHSAKGQLGPGELTPKGQIYQYLLGYFTDFWAEESLSSLVK